MALPNNTATETPLERVLDRLDDAHVRTNGAGYTARCPAHEDRNNSLSITEGEDGRVLIKCFTGCTFDEVVAALGLKPSELFPPRQGGGGWSTPANTTAQVQQSTGCTLEEYAEAKELPLDFLRSLGLSDITHTGRPVLRIPYRTTTGEEGPTRYRVALYKGAGGDNRFLWKSGSKPTLYGLERLDAIKQAGYVILVEGESDCHALWYHSIPALGVPGAGNWREDRDAQHLAGIENIYVVVEPDKGGEVVKKWAGKSIIRDRVKLLDLGVLKDPSELHRANPARFVERLQDAMNEAVSLADLERNEAQERAREALGRCRDLAQSPDILARFVETQRERGIAGEERTMQIVYLAVTSRFLSRPISIAVKGPSSGGKSYTTERTLDLFPPEAFYALSAMSDHALAYSDEPLRHRFLVIYEAAGMAGDMATYLMRSLLSEGCIKYETVEKTKDGLQARLIEREGPTGLLVTTTATHLHPENETRLLSIPVTDTPAHTRQVFRAIASGAGKTVDLTPWLALQEWLAGGEHDVTISYAQALAEEIPPVAVRLRRDFGMLLNMISAHAILHQATRGRDGEGRIVATLDDYAKVRELVSDLVSEGVEATVPDTVRETVAAVRVVRGNSDDAVTIARIAKELKLDRSAASRRVKTATDRGYLRNEETRKGKEARIVVGETLPEDASILPMVERLRDCCSRAGVSEREATPPPPPTDTPVAEATTADPPGHPTTPCPVCDGRDWWWSGPLGQWDCSRCYLASLGPEEKAVNLGAAHAA